MSAASLACGTPKYLLSKWIVSSVDGMNSDLRSLTVSVMSSSHFCAANSAVQITSEKKTSHSEDFACWRWTNWLRCSSADVGNSSSFAERPWALYLALKSLTAAVWLPDVSLPRQNVTLPLAFCDAATV